MCLESEKTEMKRKRVSGSHVLSIVVPASSVSVKFEVSLTGGEETCNYVIEKIKGK